MTLPLKNESLAECFKTGKERWNDEDGERSRLSDDALLVHIRAIHAESKGSYGWPRVWNELLARGIRVGKDRVRKLMQQTCSVAR